MDRRGFLLGAGAAVVALPARADNLPVPPGNHIGFNVMRNGTKVGEHALDFYPAGDDLVVDINVSGLVKVAGIPVYSYTMAAVERWSGGVFQSLESKVNNNGTALEVHVSKCAAGYDIEGTRMPHYVGPPNTLPLTYWNKAMLNGMIVNAQTAHSYPAIVNSPGWNRLPTANGGSLVAQRFDVTGKLHLSVWYDQFSQWSGLAFHMLGDESYEKIVS